MNSRLLERSGLALFVGLVTFIATVVVVAVTAAVALQAAGFPGWAATALFGGAVVLVAGLSYIGVAAGG